ncbi:hypothetical protein Tco_0048495 [Tanacetum coccineum]
MVENSNNEADERSSEEYLRDLDIEFHKRALLANSKRFIKRENNFIFKKQMRTLNVTNVAKKGEPKVQKYYKVKYKKMKANLALLEASPPHLSPQNPFNQRKKGLVAKMFDWDEEEVSDDEEET